MLGFIYKEGQGIYVGGKNNEKGKVNCNKLNCISQTIAINGYNCTFNGTGELTGFVEIP